ISFKKNGTFAKKHNRLPIPIETKRNKWYDIYNEGGKVMSNKKIGNRIKKIRKRKGLSQSEFGELIDNANKSLVSRWENGVILPNNHRQKLIADLVNLDVSEIFGDASNISTFNSNE